MSDLSCSVHGTEHVRAVRVSPQLVGHRCAADTGNGTKCGRIALPATFGPGDATWSQSTHRSRSDHSAGGGEGRRNATWRRRSRWRGRMWLPDRATVECIMCTLVIGFWSSALFWVPILFDRHAGP